MSDEKYIKELEEQNEELFDKLNEALSALVKYRRNRGRYVLFKMFKRKIRGSWTIDYDFQTVCDSLEAVQSCIDYAIKKPGREEVEFELIGFKFWKQIMNYKWAIGGMGKFCDAKGKRCPFIGIDPKNGKVITTWMY